MIENIFDRNRLENALDHADFNPEKPYLSKRRDSYVTEHYFEQVILPTVSDGDVSLGWCYITHNKQRQWFKSILRAEYSKDERDIDKNFMSKALSLDPEQRFFLVTVKENQIFIYLFAIENGEWFLRDIRLGSSHQWLTLKVAEMNQHAHDLLNKPELTEPFCKVWMNNTSHKYLQSLFLQRVLMNVGLDRSYPLDLDAIEINKDTLVFHEFKRKDPCPNGFFAPPDGKRGLSQLYQLRKNINAKEVEDDTDLFAFIERGLGINRDQTKLGYGLDLSHVSNFSYCEKKGIIYRHTIWNSQNYPNKPSISDLFSPKTLTPIKGCNIVARDIQMNDFAGFIFTKGPNSGTIHQDRRMQFVLDDKRFKSIKK